MGPYRRRVKDPEDTVDRHTQMIEAAAAVLARQGYEGTSMKEIAAEAGVSSGLLHYYFGTKEELLAAVVRHLHDQLTNEWHDTVQGIEDPLERITHGLRKAAEKYRTRPQFWQLLFDLYVVGLKNPVIHERLYDMITDVVSQFAEEVRRVDSSLPLPSPVDPEDLAAATLAAIDGIALVSSITGRSGDGQYRALLALMLAYAGMSYVMSGREFSIARMQELLGQIG
jgi:AcrR family transcriptional regulator